jgi:ssDNA-binding replication factor A large subunit
MGLEEAKQMAMDALDTEVVEQRFEDELVGQYYAVAGPQYGRYLLVDSMDRVGGRDDQRCEELLIEARSQVLDVADAGDDLHADGGEAAQMKGETASEAPA